MKKTFYIFSVAAALLAAGCNKSEQPAAAPSEPQVPAQETDIVLYAQDINAIDSPAMKTVTAEDENGKFTVNWIDGDQIAVYTLPSGTDPTALDLTSWQASQPVRFKTDKDMGDGVRVFILNEADSDAGKVTAFKERYAAGNLDWYAVYPGFMDAPSRAGQGMIAFGYEENGTPLAVQNRNNTMAHLARQDVLFGKAENTKEPTVNMEHLGTLMSFTVQNVTEEEFIVKSITIVAPQGENIAGQFRLHLSETPAFVGSDVRNPKNEYTLSVKDGEAIPAGGSAKFYQILAPFEIEAGESTTITVNTDKGDWSRTMTATAKQSFNAGEKNNANLNVDAVARTAVKEVTGVNLGIWNNPSAEFGPYLNLRTGGKYAKGNEESNYAGIDLVALYVNKADGGPKLAAPGDEWTFQYISGMEGIQSWPVRNKTLLKKTALTVDDYNAVQDASELKKAFDNVSGSGDTSLSALTNKNAENSIIAAKTSDGKYALIHYVKVNGWSNEANEYVTLNLKIEE